MWGLGFQVQGLGFRVRGLTGPGVCDWLQVGGLGMVGLWQSGAGVLGCKGCGCSIWAFEV